VSELSPYPTVTPAPARGSGPRWIAPTALILSLIAVAGAGWALFKPEPVEVDPLSSADPKGQVCSAYTLVSEAVSIQTKRSPGPNLGPMTAVATEAIAANARLAMAGGASYLLDQLPPNAPAELATEVRAFAGDLNSIAMNALAGIPNDREPQAGLLSSAEQSNKKLAELCK